MTSSIPSTINSNAATDMRSSVIDIPCTHTYMLTTSTNKVGKDTSIWIVVQNTLKPLLRKHHTTLASVERMASTVLIGMPRNIVTTRPWNSCNDNRTLVLFIAWRSK